MPTDDDLINHNPVYQFRTTGGAVRWSWTCSCSTTSDLLRAGMGYFNRDMAVNGWESHTAEAVRRSLGVSD